MIQVTKCALISACKCTKRVWLAGNLQRFLRPPSWV